MRLKQGFAAAGVPVLFIKGVTLAALAYGTLSLKMGWDIDILVPPDAIGFAADALSQAGYRLVIPEISTRSDQVEQWHQRFKESVWHNDERATYVELHTALVDNQMLLRGLSAFEETQEVDVAKGVRLPTLSNEALFAYLSVHGASSAWFRLKWAADLAALLDERDAPQIEALYRISQQMGAGRAAAQSLLLCAHLFGTNLGTKLGSRLMSDAASLRLFRWALRSMAGRSVATELDEMRLGTALIHLSQLELLPGWRFKLREAWRQISAMHP
jgi:hypothetical protein